MVLVLKLTDKDKKPCPKLGTFVTKFSKVIKEDCDCYVNGKILFRFRKNVIPQSQADIALKNFLKHAKKPNDNRGIAAGVFEDGKAKHMEGKFSRGNTATSGIVGFFDKPVPQHKSELKKHFGKVPGHVCRTTAFNNKNPKLFEEAIPFFKTIDSLYKKLSPKHYKSQLDFSKTVRSDFMIKDTVFTTVTTNYNWQTAIHTDRGDYGEGLGNLTVVGNDDYDGGYFGFPEWDIGVDLRSRDVIIADVHQPHCNAPITNKKPTSIRLSFVCYLRTDMAKCEIPYKDGIYVSRPNI